MSKEIIINALKQQTRIALVEDKQLVELYIENPENARTIGNIHLGRIRKVMPNIKACFVDIGQKQDAFLHFSDLSDNLPALLELVGESIPDPASSPIPDSMFPSEKPVKLADDFDVKAHKRSSGGRRSSSRSSGRSRNRPSSKPGSSSDGSKTQQSSSSSNRDSNSEAKTGDQGKQGQSRSGNRRSRSRRPSSGNRQSGPQAGLPASGQKDRGTDNGKTVSFAATETAESPITEASSVHPARYLRQGQKILVKISKEPISNKGSRVSTDISIAGRFLVLVPYTDYVAVSKKIGLAKERRRLRALADSLLPDGFGVIVRTVAENRDAKSLDTDLRLLLEKWRKIEARIKEHPEPPTALYQDVNMVSSVIRDLFTDDYDRILIDNPRTFRNIKGYVQAVAPSMVEAVKLHESDQPVFKSVGIEKSVEEAFSERVNLPSGGYLIIEHTEAMHVVDVNSGRAGHGLTQEENSLNVNLEAAKVIAHQLRLRDLGGIIAVDFIDLRWDKNRRKVHKALKEEFAKDRAVTKVLPMSNFGLVEITRQRLRPSVTTTQGKGSTDRPVRQNISIETLMKRMQNWLVVYKTKTGETAVTLRVHPFVGIHLRRKFPSYLTRWRFRYGVRIRLEITEKVDPLQFQFIDPASGENITQQYNYI